MAPENPRLFDVTRLLNQPDYGYLTLREVEKCPCK